MNVGRETGAVTVRSADWSADETRVLLCPVAPVKADPDNVFDDELLFDAACVEYPRASGGLGLEARLDLGRIDADRRAAYEAAVEWWLVLIRIVDGRTAGTYVSIIPGGPIAR